MVFSTDPDFKFESEANDEQETLPSNQQKLNIRLETKQRGGKKATLINNFKGSSADLEQLAKKIKAHCGTGGSVVDGEILVQGDVRKKVMEFLQKAGYKTNNPI
ncbi:MAG: translation initiation factor [Bacteroidia bacterium]|nr:translation initiation factor [Bacteroidia bacterium]